LSRITIVIETLMLFIMSTVNREDEARDIDSEVSQVGCWL